jgi:hypothetical protein
MLSVVNLEYMKLYLIEDQHALGLGLAHWTYRKA